MYIYIACVLRELTTAEFSPECRLWDCAVLRSFYVICTVDERKFYDELLKLYGSSA